MDFINAIRQNCRNDCRCLHHDGVVINSCIEIDNAYWRPIWLLVVVDRDLWNSAVAQHFRWLWLTLHY